MNNVIYRILGIKGRITIPFFFRKMLGFRENDILSFTIEGDKIIVKCEKLCNDCKIKPLSDVELGEFLNKLSNNERQYAINHLTKLICEK